MGRNSNRNTSTAMRLGPDALHGNPYQTKPESLHGSIVPVLPASDFRFGGLEYRNWPARIEKFSVITQKVLDNHFETF
jgi:hypothetical protein